MTTLEHLVVPIEWKALSDCEHPFQIKADEDDGNTLIGYASTFGNVDRGGDVVVKGAFTKSVNEIKAKGIPLLADHVAMTASVLGTINDAAQNDTGLVIKARISKAPSAQDTAVKLREGHLSKLSIGYETMEDAWEDREVDGMSVRVHLLKDVKLWETSVVVFPMNPEATISAVKSMVAEYLEPDARKALLTRLTEAETSAAPEATVQETSPRGAGQSETRGESSEPVGIKADTPNAGEESASAHEEGASGYDKWASRAILAGRPVTEVDPVKRAQLLTRLQLAESQLPPTDEEE